MIPSTPQYDVGVIVGRFQTHELHKGHLDLIQHVCDKHDKVVMFLGVSPLWATANNPLDFQARAQMIKARFPEIVINYVTDVDSDAQWSAALDRQLARVVSPAQSVVLYGSRDSFIPHYQGKYPVHELESESVYSGSAERKLIAAGNTKASPDFRAGVIWAAQARFPTAYATIDIAIVDDTSERVLLGRKPGATLFRFVGGFVDPDLDERLEDCARREAREETGLEIGDPVYVGSLKVDDWRYRTERDKIITSLWIAKRIYGKPEPADDIEEVAWFPVDKPFPIIREHAPLVDMFLNYLPRIPKGA